MARQCVGKKTQNFGLADSGHEDTAKSSRKQLPKRKRRALAITPSQEDGGDEVVWKVSPTAARLQAATTEPLLHGHGRAVLQPCKSSGAGTQSATGNWSSTSPQRSFGVAKKKSPGMAGKLEMWLMSMQKGPPSKSKSSLEKDSAPLEEEKENVPVTGNFRNVEPQRSIPPGNTKMLSIAGQRPPTSNQRRPLSAKKAGSVPPLVSAAKRKKLLELLDRVDSEIRRTPTSATPSKHVEPCLTRNQTSPDKLNISLDPSKAKRWQCSITSFLSPQASSDHVMVQSALAVGNFDERGSLADTRVENRGIEVLKGKQGLEGTEESCFEQSRKKGSMLQLPLVVGISNQVDTPVDTCVENTDRKVFKVEQSLGKSEQRTRITEESCNGLLRMEDEMIQFSRLDSSHKVDSLVGTRVENHDTEVSKAEQSLVKLEQSSKLIEDDCSVRSSKRDNLLQLPLVVDNLTALDIDYNDVRGLHQSDNLDPPKCSARKEPNVHFLVLEVTDGEHEVDATASYPEKTLRLLDETCGVERFACLRDSWVHSDVKPGDTVNVIGVFDPADNCVIDREHNLMIINPDLLISGSRVGSSFSCPRRTVLDERMKSNDWSYAALMGTMLHQLFQVALRSGCPMPAALESNAKAIVQRNLDGLYATGVAEKEALLKLVGSIPTIISWWEQYVGAKVTTGRDLDPASRRSQRVSVSEIVDIEEMIWSPKYGLKGMIDASVMGKFGNLSLENEDQVMPLEFKTGKATNGQAGVEHRAQVILYTLLMSDRYMEKVGAGLLYYLHTNQTQEVKVQQNEVVGLVMRRNELARDLLKASASQSLPPMLQNYQMCQNCRQLDTCAIYHKAQDGGTGDTSGLGELFDRSTNYLTTTDIHFFQQWDRLIDLEFRDLLMSHSEIWRMPSSKREELGRCISSLVLCKSANLDTPKDSSGSYLYSFRRSYVSSQDMTTPSASLQARPFTCGDYVVLSTESGQTGVAGGTVASIDENVIVIRLSHRLHSPRRPQTTKASSSDQDLWRIDKDESASIMATMRFNLLQLFIRGNGDEQRRRLIVGLEAPKFDSGPNDDTDRGLQYVKSATDLNSDQRHAINRVLSAKDYTLILGMPGTGKTSTIVHTVIALMRRGLSVLLTSYTNSAVDNILLKLKRMDVDFIRVGRSNAVHPELRDKILGEGKSVTSVEEFASVVEHAQVVGVTCLGVTHALFSKRKFDVCIVDEAGQITLPICLGPLRCAQSFVLVGDHYQLPPLVRTPEAREDGMAVSLFRRLSEEHPHSICALQSQYRMCADIMALSNSLIYGGRLRCGSPYVANGSLRLSSPPEDLPPWLLQVIDPEQRVLFLNTDKLSIEESRVRNKIYNKPEASLVLKIVEVIHGGGVDVEKIGVISPYNAQVDHIQRLAMNAGFPDLEVHTVDKYQGRDKDCVLISFVRSNSKGVSGSLLADWHRINVAITRAKTKLVLLGSRATLSSAPILKLLIEKVEEIGGLLQLPSEALAVEGC